MEYSKAYFLGLHQFWQRYPSVLEYPTTFMLMMASYLLCFTFQQMTTLIFQPQESRQYEACISEMRAWLAIHMLLCNDDNPEQLMLFDSYQKELIDFHRLSLALINPSEIVRNIGFVIDTGLACSSQSKQCIQQLVFYLKNITSIYDHLTHDAAETLLHGYVTNKLDYCNSVLFGLPNYYITRLQYLQIWLPDYSHVLTSLTI